MPHPKNLSSLLVIFILLSLVVPANLGTIHAATGDPHTISGIVRDATPNGHTWPLYARIDIAGFSGSPIFTDPVTGAYSVVLEEGASYDFTISAVNTGYQSVTQTVAIPAGGLVVNFGLGVEPVACEAQGYSLVDHWSENFDSVTEPALPAGWASQVVSGTPDPWITRMDVNVYPYAFAHSPINLASFHTTSGIARLGPTTPIDMTALPNQILTFWMFQNGGYPNDPATLRVMVSTDGGQIWVQAGPEFNYYDSASGWFKQVVDLSAFAGQTGLLFGFESGTWSGMGYIFIDTVSLGATCDPVVGGLFTGRVLDANTGLAVNGAKVQSSLDKTFSQGTPLDAGLGDGFYSLFAPAGATVVTAAKIPYQPLSQTLTLAAETVAPWTFLLPAGRLAGTPDPINQTLPMNGTANLVLGLSNTGSASAEFKLNEINRSPIRAAALSVQTSAPMPGPGAGEVLSSFSTGLWQIWGLAYNPLADDLWIQDVRESGTMTEDNLLVRFGIDGTNSGDRIISNSETNFYSDLAFNPLTGSLWQTGINSCIYEFDLLSRQATGNTICLQGKNFNTLVYDPLTNTYLASGVDSNQPSYSNIFRFNPQGEILASGKVSQSIMGLTFNPATGHLFGVSGGSSIYIIDANSFNQIGEININPPLFSYLVGIDMDCDGSLWLANSDYSQMVYEIASGESGACDWMDIPWLNEDTTSGTISAGGAQPVGLTFDAAGLMPGTYKAQMNISHDTPYSVARLPITMTVTLAEGYGGISGTVNGLEPCDVNPAALSKALVEIIPEGQVYPVYTTTPNADGQYGWANPTAGSYTVRVSADGYVSQSAAFTLTIDQMQTQNFTLRRNLPCITSSAASIHTSLPPNAAGTMGITLANTGAVGDTFILSEQTAGASLVSEIQAASLLSEGFEAAFPPSGWELIRSSGDFWSSWLKNDMAYHTGMNSAYVLSDASHPKNEWLLTPEFSLAAGSLSFWSMGSVSMCKGSITCDLNVWLVVGEPGGEDDILIGRGEDAWTADSTWAQSTFDLTPLLPDSSVRIGFQYSGLPVGNLGLDDILLEGIEGTDIPWLSESPTSGQILANGGSQIVTLTFNSNGLEIGSYHAILHIVPEKGSSFDIPVTLNVVSTDKKVFIPLVQR